MSKLNQAREVIHDVSPLLDISCHLRHGLAHAYRVELQWSQSHHNTGNELIADFLEIGSVLMDQIGELPHHPRS